METIFALCTAPGKAGVAVVRVSGPLAWHACKKLCGFIPGPRELSLRVVRNEGGKVLDEALVVCFEKEKSFTGEDICEFQLHGSTAIVSAVLFELGNCEGLKIAEPGEFTRQALENGCLDLVQVEGLADLIEAETEVQRQQAQRVLSGSVSVLAKIWRVDLIRAAALLEATIDFVDEDVPVDVLPEVVSLVQKTLAALRSEVAGVTVAERVREGFEVAIVGPPNVGKSTLLNALAGRDAAITSEYAGTTRDIVEVRMDIEGLPVLMIDTAGIREASEPIEQIGINRAKQRASSADMRIFLIEANENIGIDMLKGDICVTPKADLLGLGEASISGLTGFGVAQLMARVASELRDRYSVVGCLSRDRHRVAGQEGIQHLSAVLELVSAGHFEADIAAEEIRSAVVALRRLVGSIDVEDVLDDIFSSFCIGK
ncbi:MAG: tRNA uridine-5-carboxymethylaminomethyl(34) synthesis GTPase MnmE [Paracoccaceae bacterium]|nr:tRNA uridine-5-carboxymethylaminomethyl(34) synthesis GTPase MnmE [Paracoccaceae bacterium]